MSTTFPEVIDQWAQAELKGDTGALATLIGDDFTGVGPRGFTLDKAAWLKRYDSGDLVNQEFTVEEPAYRSYGPVAILTAVQNQVAAHQGHPFPGKYRITVVGVDETSGWKIVNVQLSQIVDPSQQQQRPQ